MVMRNQRLVRWAGIVVLVMMVMLGAGHYRTKAAQSGAASEGNGQPFVIEYYYKAKWGHADEFLALFKKNHYPVLKKEMELGRMLKVSMAAPRYHTTEDGRWDFRVTIVFKNAAIANDDFDSAEGKHHEHKEKMQHPGRQTGAVRQTPCDQSKN